MKVVFIRFFTYSALILIGFFLKARAQVIPTNEWVNFHSSHSVINGVLISAGSVIDAYDPTGIHCGRFTVTELGKFGFLKVYKDDEFTQSKDEGCVAGDTIFFKINGYPATVISGSPIWSTHGDVVELELRATIAGVIPTNEWVNFYSKRTTFNGSPVAEGSVINAYTAEMIHCGTILVSVSGQFGFLKVYGDDILSPVKEGGIPGESISFKINEKPAVVISGSPVWTAHGETIELDLADAQVPLTVFSPNGGENLTVGTSYLITWISTAASISRVRLEYSPDSGTSWKTIIDDTTNSGTYNWTVPDTSSDNCLIQISDVQNTTVFDRSDHVFTITKPGNSPPSKPLLVSPENNFFTDQTTPSLKWVVPADIDENTLHFKVEFSIDSSFYSIFQSYESKSNLAGFNPIPPVAQGTGQMSYTVQSPISEGNYWWRVTAWDGQVYGNYSEKRKLTIDLTAPNVTNHNPSKNANGVAINSNIIVQIQDALSGINESSLVMKVNDNQVTPQLTGTTKNFTLTYDPANDFNYEQTITVSIDVTDIAGNIMPTDSYSFTTGTAGNTAPAAPTLAFPANATYLNQKQLEFTWSVPSDPDSNALHFKLELDQDHDWKNISQIIESKTNLDGFSPTPPVNPGTDSMHYATQSALEEGDWWWRVAAWDGQVYGSYSNERYFMIDVTKPVVTGHSPAKDATNVAVNSNIVVQLQDNLSGIDSTSTKMQVNGTEVAPQLSGTPNNYTLTYEPLSDFAYSSTVLVSLDAADLAGNQMETESYSFSTTTGSDIFSINHTTITVADSGQIITVDASFAESVTIQSAHLFYRKGGATTYNSIQMEQKTSNFFQAMLPGSAVTERGVEYYISAENVQGTLATSPQVSAESSPHTVQVKITNLPNPNRTKQAIYQMFSAPLILDNGRPGVVLIDDLGEYDKTQWRLFQLQDGNYAEFSGGTLDDFAPGRCFWLITRTEQLIDVGSGSSVPTNANFEIELQPGWNMIGNPFNFSVSWDSVSRSEQVEAPVAYVTSENSTQGFEYGQMQLTPWQGYAVKNLASETIKIEIPPLAVEAGLAKNKSFTTRYYAPGEWLLQLTTECGQYIDRENYLGCLTSAANQWDKNDFSEAPPIDKYLSLYFPHPDWQKFPGNFTGDFRALTENGASWDFSVATNLTEKNVKLSLTQKINIPAPWEIILFDQTAEISIDLRAQSEYSFPVGDRNFRLFVGKSEFMDQNEVTTDLVASNFMLFQNYPNPFNPKTAIRYWLPEASRVVLKVYNLSGQEIKILVSEYQPSGTHLREWDGCLTTGERVPSGIYWYQLEAGGVVQVRKMVLAR